MTTPTPAPVPVIVQVPNQWAWSITCSRCGQATIVYEGTMRSACISYVNSNPAAMVSPKKNYVDCGRCPR